MKPVSAPTICFRYMANTETYLKNVGLKHMPPNLQKVSLLKSGEYILTPGSSHGSGAVGKAPSPAGEREPVLSLSLQSFVCSSKAQPGLLRVPAGAGAAGEHPGGAGV